MELPFQNIRQVTIADHAPDWNLTIDSASFATGSSPILIDPVVAGLLKGPAVTTNVNAIAAATTGFVQGAGRGRNNTNCAAGSPPRKLGKASP